MLGLQPELDGMRIDPCIPSSWSGFSTIRRFRGQRLHITVHNPQHVCKGVVKMSINGEQVLGNLIPAGLPGDVQHVEIWLGAEGGGR
jgi:cellobiose phosphorylase